jgi:hypothetical protein
LLCSLLLLLLGIRYNNQQIIYFYQPIYCCLYLLLHEKFEKFEFCFLYIFLDLLLLLPCMQYIPRLLGAYVVIFCLFLFNQLNPLFTYSTLHGITNFKFQKIQIISNFFRSFFSLQLKHQLKHQLKPKKNPTHSPSSIN